MHIEKVFPTLLVVIIIYFKSNAQENIPYYQLKGAAREAALFKDLYENEEKHREVLEKIKQQPSESATAESGEGWKSIGPGFSYSDPPLDGTNRINTGRVVDIEWTESGGLRLLSASGGLFINNCAPPCYEWKPISDKLNTLRGGAFASNPQNTNTIFLGTGEPGIQGGTGLYRTYDLGEHWEEINLNPFPSTFYKVQIDPMDSLIIHVACNLGYYRSYDGGEHFQRTFTGEITDFEINPLNSNIMYCARIDAGYFKSYDNGLNWYIMPEAPGANLGRSELAICPVDTALLFTTATTRSSNYTGNKWIYRSEDSGASWDSCALVWECNPPGSNCYNFYDGQAWYNNALSISPDDCSAIIAGGVALLKGENTTDSCWLTQVHFIPGGNEHHPDQHDVAWQINPTGPPTAWIANDGGIAYAYSPYINFEGGDANNMPIFQIYEAALVDSIQRSIGIATQDNKTILNNQSTGHEWIGVWGGDGFSVDINPIFPNQVFMVNNNYLISTNNGGVTTNFVDIPLVREGKVRFGSREQPTIYVQGWDAGNAYFDDLYIFASDDNGNNWYHLNQTAFDYNVQTFKVGRGIQPNVYVSMFTPETDWSWGERLMVRDRVDGEWYERSAGIHTDDRVEDVQPDMFDPDIAVLYMNNGTERSAADNIYFTENRGQNWTNITGDLPGNNVRAALIYPYNRDVIVVGSIESGCYITRNGGQNWERWNLGMPEANMVWDLLPIDSVAANGKFYVVASSYGRSLWMREINDNDFTGINTPDLPESIELFASFNNNSTLNVNYKIAISGSTQIMLYSVDGKLLYSSSASFQNKGMHTTSITTNDLAAGIYILEFVIENERKTIKVVK